MICPVDLSRQGPGTIPSQIGIVTLAVVIVVVLFVLLTTSKFILGITGMLFILLASSSLLLLPTLPSLLLSLALTNCEESPASGDVGIFLLLLLLLSLLLLSLSSDTANAFANTESESITAIIVPNIAFDVFVPMSVCYYILCCVMLCFICYL
jgi:hypothetical protein